MILLALETSTEACSVAVLHGGQVLERFELAPRRHAELVLPWCTQLLDETGIARSQLDAIAVSRGPGAFTGVRLGIAVAQGLALGLDRPLVPVSTLAVLAMEAVALVPPREELTGELIGTGVLATLDARMQEVYACGFEFDGEGVAPLAAETLGPPDGVDLPAGDRQWVGVGTGLAAMDGALRAHLGGRLRVADATALPRAGQLARLGARAMSQGGAVAPQDVEPAYLRNQVALTITEQQALRASRR